MDHERLNNIYDFLLCSIFSNEKRTFDIINTWMENPCFGYDIKYNIYKNMFDRNIEILNSDKIYETPFVHILNLQPELEINSGGIYLFKGSSIYIKPLDMDRKEIELFRYLVSNRNSLFNNVNQCLCFFSCKNFKYQPKDYIIPHGIKALMLLSIHHYFVKTVNVIKYKNPNIYKFNDYYNNTVNIDLIFYKIYQNKIHRILLLQKNIVLEETFLLIYKLTDKILKFK